MNGVRNLLLTASWYVRLIKSFTSECGKSLDNLIFAIRAIALADVYKFNSFWNASKKNLLKLAEVVKCAVEVVLIRVVLRRLR